ncbi:hypothetical protein [Ancylomarina longa]|uniref:DUF1579 domain-containing protein n=1 Tax=Ancylomarina longa TaxID=2487017 RepID=A0A434AGF7_9BACT|nr:hypothetical protein [Ancylomarina longa]RUT73466.1 hypothetical protein DLK05_13375 [Ancylomarina longa]
MKYIRYLILLCLLFSGLLSAQQQSPLEAFDRFVQGKWLTEGKWSNGNPFKQEVQFSWNLNHKLVEVKTYGTINRKTNEYGLRNKGMRAWNMKDSVIQFWEFDVFGGITSGVCYFKDKNLIYEYNYHQEQLRESWIFEDEDTYKYQIANLKNGKVLELYMESSYRRIKE